MDTGIWKFPKTSTILNAMNSIVFMTYIYLKLHRFFFSFCCRIHLSTTLYPLIIWYSRSHTFFQWNEFIWYFAVTAFVVVCSMLSTKCPLIYIHFFFNLKLQWDYVIQRLNLQFEYNLVKYLFVFNFFLSATKRNKHVNKCI